MRIGTIAQHANIGPNGPDSILPNGNIPGRLNDFPLIGWWDFTDNKYTVTVEDTGTNNLNSALDKGPYSANLSSDSSAKGPSYPAITENGQDGHKFITTHLTDPEGSGITNDSMKFTNPININSRRFTAVIICDLTPTVLPADMRFFQLNGSDNGKFFFMWDEFSVFDRLWVQREKTGSTTRFAYGANSNQYYDDVVGGDNHYNFNWFTVVAESDGTISIYARGIKIDVANSGAFDDTTIADKGVVSYLFDGRTSSTSITTTSNIALGSNIYEVMMFDESLSHKQLYSIDMYIKNKYNSYQFGRVNGF